MAVQKSPVWSDDGFEEERGEDASFVEFYEHNVDNLAIDVVGQHWTSQVISLFLRDWEVGRVALSCHLSMDLLCKELRVSRFSSLLVFGVGAVTAAKPLSRRGRAVTRKEWGCGEK